MGNLIQYTHSVVDNRRKMAVQYSHGRIYERDFDILDRISKLSIGQENIADFSYIGKAYRMLSKQCGNGDAIDFVYDQGRRLNTKETKNRNQGLINKYIYGYNRVGMKMFEQRGHDNNKGDAYAYDEVYRLTGVKFNSPEPANPATDLFEKRWASQLDKVDNILKIVRQTESGTSEITSIIEGVNAQLNQYTRFDEWGLSYDLNGNTTQRGTQHFTYDYRNRIVSVQGLGVAVNYNYDPFNRRVEKILGSGTVKYLYDGDQVIEERDGNDNVLRQYVWGNGIDELIAIYVKDGDNFKAYYPHTNGSGSITAITNDQGEVIERVQYDVYGMPTFLDANNQPLANNQSTIGNNYLFQGREYDKETNLYYYRARYYDPIMGRFLQTDPMGYEDSMNLYQGFNMNPVNFMDPFGLWKRKGEWSGNVAYVISKKGDTLPELATLITGNPEDWVFLGMSDNVGKGQKVNVVPLIVKLKNTVKNNIVKNASNAPGTFRCDFSTAEHVSLWSLNEAKINSLFEPNTPVHFTDCSGAAAIIRAKGIIDSLKPGEFEALGFSGGYMPYTQIGYWDDKKQEYISSSTDINDVEIGDQTMFLNKEDYSNRFPNAGMAGEHVTKIGDDLYFGFGFDSPISYEDWKIELSDDYNSRLEPDQQKFGITSRDVRGYIGFIIKVDYFKLGQMLFDLRNKRKK